MSDNSCPACLARNTANARFCASCGKPLSTVSQSPYESPASQQDNPAMVANFAFAGFWKRFIAWIVDGIIYTFLVWLIMLLFGISFLGDSDPKKALLAVGIVYLVSFVGWWLYFSIQESSDAQATLGKRLLGIKVTDMLGQPLSFGQATGRHFAGFLSYISFSIGYLMAAFTARKQALHDMVASTLVVNRMYGPNQIKVASANPAPGMSVGGIIGIIFLVLLIPVGGIIAAIALPAYQDYTIRAKVAQAIAETQPVKMHIVAHAEESGYWPNNLQQAGLQAEEVNTESYQVQISQDGIYHIIFTKPQLIASQRIDFEPQLESSGRYTWRCYSQSMQNKYLPKDCRN